MRELLYAAYLRFPRAFYDVHPTGQVVSRATNDLYPIRYFIGWGHGAGARAVMMVVGAGIVLVLDEPDARALERAAAAADRRRGVALRAPRDADLARGPAAQGRRHGVGRRGRRRHRDGAGVRARGRRAGALRRARRRGSATRSSARRASSRSTCPASSTCRRCRSRSCSSSAAARDRGHAHVRRVRALHHAAAAARVAARVDGLDHQPRPARAGLRRPLVRLARPGADAARAGSHASRCRPARSGVSLCGVQLRLPGRRARAARRRPRGRARRGARGLRRAPAQASRRCSGSCRASTTRRTASVAIGGRDLRALAIADVHGATALVTQRPDPVLRHAARQPARRSRRMRRGPRSSARARSRA